MDHKPELRTQPAAPDHLCDEGGAAVVLALEWQDLTAPGAGRVEVTTVIIGVPVPIPARPAVVGPVGDQTFPQRRGNSRSGRGHDEPPRVTVTEDIQQALVSTVLTSWGGDLPSAGLTYGLHGSL